MVRIAVVGGTGYAGSAIAQEAAARGHEVAVFSRRVPEQSARVEGVRYAVASVLDEGDRARVIEGVDVVVSALSPRGELDGRIVEADLALALLAGARGTRFGVVGGFSSLRLQEGGPRMAETGEIPPEFAGEALQMNEVLSVLAGTGEEVDWFFVSPAMMFGAYAPGERRGQYRVGGEVALFDGDGVSALSGADFAAAVVDEIERPVHRRVHFGVAY